MSNRLCTTEDRHRQSKIQPKRQSEEESVAVDFNAMRLEKVKELEEKLKKFKKLLTSGRKHAGIALLAAKTKKRLEKAREMCDIHTLVQVKIKNMDSHSDDKAAVRSKSPSNSNSLSKDYGNYYSMRCHILHMESRKQAIIDSKGLQSFLSEYQTKLAKCFQFEQNQTVHDLFATSRIHKLAENINETREHSVCSKATPSASPISTGLRSTKILKSTVSEESMSEVTMEEDLDTLVSKDDTWKVEIDSPVNADVLRETNFLDQFLSDKVLEFLEAATSTDGMDSSTLPLLGMGNVSESVSDWRLEHLMSLRVRNNRSVASLQNHFVNIEPNKSLRKSADVIPIKQAVAMTNIKKRIMLM